MSTEPAAPGGDDLDLTKEPPTTTPVVDKGERFDPDPHRERMRGLLAMWLLGLLTLLILAAPILFWVTGGSDALLRLLEVLYGPVVGLVGAVTGFYYGSATRRD